MSVLVAPLASAIDLAACIAIEEASFDRPSFDLRAEARRPHAVLLAARLAEDAPPVGFLLAWHVADELQILTVAVHPEGRRRGAGRALVRAAIDLARARAIRLLVLEVRKSNAAAIALYAGEGFVVTGERERYYEGTEDAVEMAARLDDEGRVVPPE